MLVVVRVSAAHWHLCHDGNEAPRSVHIGDIATDDKTEPGHTDTDLNLVDSGLFKQIQQAGDLPALLSAILLCCLFSMRQRSTPTPYYAAFYPSVALRRVPPPRGPPR